jgi:hypothetical protein
MVKRTGTYLLIQERLKTPLDEHIRSEREAGVSWNAIAIGLYDKTQVVVTPETLRNWTVTTEQLSA